MNRQITRDWIVRLFDNMKMLYGAKFTRQWGDADKRQLIDFWFAKLADFSAEEIRRGVQALDRLDWLPTLPEFAKLCRPDIDKTAAYYEAIAGMDARRRGEKGEWSHPAIFWAATSLSHDLLNMTYAAVKSRFEKALDRELARTKWQAIPDVPKALPSPDINRDAAKKQLDNLGASSVLLPPEDHLGWAKRIMERVKAGDKSVPNISLKRAKEALGIQEAA